MNSVQGERLIGMQILLQMEEEAPDHRVVLDEGGLAFFNHVCAETPDSSFGLHNLGKC